MQGRHVSRGPKLTRGGGEAADPRPRSRRPRPFPEPPSRAVPADPPALPRRPLPAPAAPQPRAPTPRSGFQGQRARARFRSRPPRGGGGERRSVHLPRGREWRRPAPRSQLRVPARRKPAEPGAAGYLRWERRERTYLRTVPSAEAAGGGRGVPGAEQVPARRRRLPQCPPPHCFPSKRIPAKPSPGTRKFPGATPPAAAMETAPASQGGSPGTPPPRRQPRPPHGPPPTVAAAAAAAAILARPERPLPGGTCALLPRSRRPRGRAARAAGGGRSSRDARPETAPGTPRRRGKEEGREGPGGTAERGPRAGLRGIARKRQASAGVN